MTTELGRQLIYAFAQDQQGGNPSYVIATRGQKPDLTSVCIAEAEQRACEVTHIHFEENDTEPEDASLGIAHASVHFYVATGPIAFCGHGALAATAFAANNGLAEGTLLLHYENKQVQMHIQSEKKCCGFIEPPGDWLTQELDGKQLGKITTMLGLPELPSDRVQLWLGGRQCAKALIGLPTKESLKQTQLDRKLRDQFCLQHQVTGIYLFSMELGNATNGRIAARHFPLHADYEDMATGNIASTVAELVTVLKKDGQREPLTIVQGGPECDVAYLHLVPHGSHWFVGGDCRF